MIWRSSLSGNENVSVTLQSIFSYCISFKKLYKCFPWQFLCYTQYLVVWRLFVDFTVDEKCWFLLLRTLIVIEFIITSDTVCISDRKQSLIQVTLAGSNFGLSKWVSSPEFFPNKTNAWFLGLLISQYPWYLEVILQSWLLLIKVDFSRYSKVAIYMQALPN